MMTLNQLSHMIQESAEVANRIVDEEHADCDGCAVCENAAHLAWHLENIAAMADGLAELAEAPVPV